MNNLPNRRTFVTANGDLFDGLRLIDVPASSRCRMPVQQIKLKSFKTIDVVNWNDFLKSEYPNIKF